MRPRRTGPGGVRISAGKWKGKALELPAGARPTSARAREAFFDILGPRVVGARILDLHAGSGAVAFEALSRGADRAVLVDVDAAAARRNAERLGAGGAAEILESGAAEAVRGLVSKGVTFDVLFSDPPYSSGSEAAFDPVPLLAEGGVFVVQSDAGERLVPPRGLVAARERAYGRNVFHFFERPAEPVPPAR